VRAFVDDILVTGRTEKLAGYFNVDKHIEHNPQIADNLSGLDSALRSMAAQGIRMKYERVHKVLGRGISCLWSARMRAAGSRRRSTICCA
jgi:hypothetical protein